MAKRIYISGPITGYDIDDRKAVFQAVKEQLLREGWAVFNPMDNGLPQSATREAHMRRDICMLTKCDAIYLMPDWEKANGCVNELFTAVQCGIKVLTWDNKPIDRRVVLLLQSNIFFN